MRKQLGVSRASDSGMRTAPPVYHIAVTEPLPDFTKPPERQLVRPTGSAGCRRLGSSAGRGELSWRIVRRLTPQQFCRTISWSVSIVSFSLLFLYHFCSTRQTGNKFTERIPSRHATICLKKGDTAAFCRVHCSWGIRRALVGVVPLFRLGDANTFVCGVGVSLGHLSASGALSAGTVASR